jgi:hypothetical protein
VTIETASQLFKKIVKLRQAWAVLPHIQSNSQGVVNKIDAKFSIHFEKGLNTGLLIPLLFGSNVVFPFFFPETVSTMKAINGLNCMTMRGTPTQFIGTFSSP